MGCAQMKRQAILDALAEVQKTTKRLGCFVDLSNEHIMAKCLDVDALFSKWLASPSPHYLAEIPILRFSNPEAILKDRPRAVFFLLSNPPKRSLCNPLGFVMKTVNQCEQ